MGDTSLLICRSYMPAEGTGERSELTEVTAQRLQGTSPPLGGHFFLQLSDTVIPGKGAIRVQRFHVNTGGMLRK